MKGILEAKGLARSNDAVTDAIRTLCAKSPWDKWSPETLWRKYWVALKLHGDSPAPPMPALPSGVTLADWDRELSLLRKWGRLGRPPLAPEDTPEFLARLYASAGGPHRPVGRMLEMISKRYGIVDHEKIEWLRVQEREMAADPQYYPRSRPEIVNRCNLDLVLKVVSEAPGAKADIPYIMRKTRKTRDSVVNLTRRLCAENKLVRIAPGAFTLPGFGDAHIPAHKQVLAVLEAAPLGTEYKAVELANMLGRPRGTIDAALHGHGALVRDGKVICVRRGVFVRRPPACH